MKQMIDKENLLRLIEQRKMAMNKAGKTMTMRDVVKLIQNYPAVRVNI